MAEEAEITEFKYYPLIIQDMDRKFELGFDGEKFYQEGDMSFADALNSLCRYPNENLFAWGTIVKHIHQICNERYCKLMNVKINKYIEIFYQFTDNTKKR